VHSSWQTRTALLAWSALSFCFRSYRSMPLTLFSLRTKRCSRSLYLTAGRTNSVADCGNFWRRSLAFSWVLALRGLPLPGRLLTVCVPQLLEQLINTTLGPAFLRKFICQPLRCVPFQIQTFYQILSSSLNVILTVDKHCSDASAVTNFRRHKLIAKVNKQKIVPWKILFAISMEKN